MIKLSFLKELILIKQMNKKSVVLFHYRHFADKGFKF